MLTENEKVIVDELLGRLFDESKLRSRVPLREAAAALEGLACFERIPMWYVCDVWDRFMRTR